MKKLTIISLLLLTAFHLSAQDDASIPGSSSNRGKSGASKFFLTITGGPALPLGDFASTDLNSETSGGAITGLNFGIDASYIIKNGFGVAINWSGASHFFDNSWFTDLSTWSYGNLMIGPTYAGEKGKLLMEGHLMGGRTVLTYDLDDAGFSDTGSGFGIMIGGSIKFNIKGFLLSGGIDYVGSNPYFDFDGYEQPVGALFVKGGIGFAL